jgi:hypothetical protein
MGSEPSPVRAARRTLVVIAVSQMLSTLVMQDRVAAPPTCTVQAQRLAAVELGPGHAEHVAPTAAGVAVDIDLMGCAVDL